MDHPHYRYQPSPERPVVAWPGGAPLAVFVLLHLEYWEIDAPPGDLSDPRFQPGFGSFHPDYRTWSLREYGARVGMERILRLLDALDMRASVAVDVRAARHYAPVIEQIVRGGHEIVAHGQGARRMMSSRMSVDEQRTFVAESLNGLEEACGVRPTGWLSQDFGHSADTPQILAEAGLRYALDWPNDDRPYCLETTPAMVSIPAQVEWDDANLWARKVPPWRYPEMITDAAQALAAEGGGRLLGVSLRPWISGAPFRFKYVAEALRHLHAGGHWHATAGEMAQAWLQT